MQSPATGYSVHIFSKSYHCNVSKHIWDNPFWRDFYSADLFWYTDDVYDMHSHDPDDTSSTRILGISSPSLDHGKLSAIGGDIEKLMEESLQFLRLIS